MAVATAAAVSATGFASFATIPRILPITEPTFFNQLTFATTGGVTGVLTVASICGVAAGEFFSDGTVTSINAPLGACAGEICIGAGIPGPPTFTGLSLRISASTLSIPASTAVTTSTTFGGEGLLGIITISSFHLICCGVKRNV